MSRNTSKSKNVQRRSALSFCGGDDTIEDYIEHVLQSESYKNTEEIEDSDVARIQNVLTEFDEIITQEKTLKADQKVPKKSRKKSTEKSTTEDSITNSEGSSSNMHSDTSVPKSKVETRKKATSTKRASKAIEKTSPRESLQHSSDDMKKAVRKTSESSVKEIAVHDSTRKTIMKEARNIIAIKSAIEDLITINSEGSSSDVHSDILVPKSKVETREKAISKAKEKTSPRESLQHSSDDVKKAVRKTSESSVKKIALNDSIRKTIMKEARNMIDIKSAIEDLITNSEGSFSDLHSDILVPKSKVETREKAISKAIEKTSPRESLQHSSDDVKKAVRKTSASSVKEIALNDSIRKRIMKEVSTNTIDINRPKTSTPQKSPRTVKKTVKDEKSTEEKKKKKLKTRETENKPKKYVKLKEKKQSTKTSKKNAKEIEHCQDNENMSNKEETTNMEGNILECKKENHNASKKKAKQQKMQCKNISNESKKLEKSKNKLQKSATSNKSRKSLKNNAENKCQCNKCQCKNQSTSQCKKECVGNYELKQQLIKQLKAVEQEEKKEREKNIKAAKAMGKLSHKISDVKKKIECIKYDLESSESDSSSDYSETSSYSSDSGSSCSTNCDCTECERSTSDDSTEDSCDSDY